MQAKMRFDPKTWDGNDFFFLQDSFDIVVTERVKTALASLKSKSIGFLSLLDHKATETEVALWKQRAKKPPTAEI